MDITEAIGKGSWIDETFIAETCPICMGEYTFRYRKSGVWECVECKKRGFENELADVVTDLFVKRNLNNLDKPAPPDGLIVVSEYKKPKNEKITHTGINKIDRLLGGFVSGQLTVLTGKRSHGKSTFGGQITLNAINQNVPVCFYSGELGAGMFQHWITLQAAGIKYLNGYVDFSGAERWQVDTFAERHIKTWLDKKLILYDNSIVKSSEHNTILERFASAHDYYGCELFFVDNLMTARYAIDSDRDYYRAQSNFVGQLVDFAMERNVHVVLVAHPRKGESGDINDDVGGSSDITNRAANVIQITRLSDEKSAEFGYGSVATVAKNRNHGDIGRIGMNFEKGSKRFIGEGMIERYGWEDLC